MAGAHNAPKIADSTGGAERLAFDLEFRPEAGRADEVSPGIVRIVAPNANSFTFTGTNTYLIGRETLFILDPGPDDQNHLDAILKALDGRPVAAVLLTHTHKDHSVLAKRLGNAIGTPIWFGGRHRLSRPLHRFEFNVLAGSCDWELVPDRVLKDGDEISVGPLALRVMATPGHCANHLGFGIMGGEHLFSGDHVMGWNSTLVATPDGDMSDYFMSLERLIASPWSRYLPGHGGPIHDGKTYARGLRAHREMRNGQIVDAVFAGARSVPEVVEQLYPGVPSATHRAAAMTVLAHAEHLERAGRIGLKWRWGRARLSPA